MKIKIIAGAVFMLLFTFILKNIFDLRDLNASIKGYQSKLEYYKLKATADSLLNCDKVDDAMVLFSTLDSLTSSQHHTSMALGILEERSISNTNYSRLSAKLQRRSSVIGQLLANKNELNDSLENIKTTLGTLQHEYDSILVSNSHISQKVDALNDSIGAINLMDALTLLNADGVTIRYIGEIKDGKAEGFGYAIFDSKSFYEGNWKGSTRCGNGKYYWPNGDVYEGEYANDLRNGYGTYHFGSGEQYIGQWQDDLRHGDGILKDKDGKVLFEGQWENNEPIKKAASS